MAAEHRKPVEPDAAPLVEHHAAHHAATAEAPGAPADTGDQPDPNRWKALVICLLGGGIVLLDVGVQATNVLNQTRLFAIDPAARSRR
ncbi:hypothetical protein IAE22_31965, partial [Bacillus sp. S34]|nr:hypothetical protein [Bacillus sp. S34]